MAQRKEPVGTAAEQHAQNLNTTYDDSINRPLEQLGSTEQASEAQATPQTALK